MNLVPFSRLLYLVLRVYALPRSLAEIRSLTTGLEKKPLTRQMLFRRRLEAKFVGRIILLNKILDDGSRFPKSDTSCYEIQSQFLERQRPRIEISNSRSLC